MALFFECLFYKPKLASYSIGFGASQGRPHVASLSFLTDRTKVHKFFICASVFFCIFLGLMKVKFSPLYFFFSALLRK